MRIVQLTPGAGGMFCGNCLRDNALVAALRRQGHEVTMLPLYLPLKTDEPDQSLGKPVFFGGINVYLEQQSALFRRLPRWLHRLLDSPRLLRWVGTAAARTRPEDVGELTVSMLRGELGHQRREIDELVAWLRDHERPEVISLSNALLAGCARQLKRELGARLVITLQGEEAFLDALPPREREAAWNLVAERVAEADVLVTPSHYYARRLAQRLHLPESRFHVVPNGIQLAGWEVAPSPPQPPRIGFLARMCQEKGLDLLVDAFLDLRRRGRVPGTRLAVAGSLGPSDEAFVTEQKRKLQAAGLLGETEFHPNLDHPAKQRFLRDLTVFSVPAHYGEAFGLYLVEAMAAGVPIVQPDTGAFPEILADSGAGILCRAHDAADLSQRLEQVLVQPELAARLSTAGRRAAEERYHSDASARAFAALLVPRTAVPSTPAPTAG
ncbi:MAG: glycosyltransferase family 4 protein [Verrucomicrobiales bacterium]|nr:glycosyltransferase family 4 protein [Verrucomicrobiales bacterium]